jgi:anti-sigma regulatory factor (Ser/Thr protein kinase)
MSGEFAHPALFYRDREEYLAGTVPFVLDGLAAGEPVAVSVPAVNVALLRVALGADAERVRFADMAVVGRNPGRIIPGVLLAFADAHPEGRVRIIGEPIWAGRTAAEYAACAQHEALINLAFAGRPVTILCPYDRATLHPDVLAEAAVTHPELVDADGTRPSAHYDPHRVVAAHNQPLPVPSHAATMRFDLGTVSAARRFAVRVARLLRLPAVRTDDLEVAVSELAANSVKHGGGRGSISIWTEHGHLVCQVQDAGRLTDPLSGRLPVPPGSLGGRGLLLVNHLVDLVRVYASDDRTAVRIHIERHTRDGS